MSKSLNKLFLSIVFLLGASSLYAQLNFGEAYTIKNLYYPNAITASSNSGDLCIAIRQTDDYILSSDTVFQNNSFTNATMRIMSVSPQGQLKWTITSQRDFNGVMFDIKSSEFGEFYLLGGFYGSIQIGNHYIENSDTTSTAFSDLEYFMLKINGFGEIVYLIKLPNTIDNPLDFRITDKSEVLISVRYDSILSMDNFILNEMPVSLSNGAGASAIIVLNPSGFATKVIGIDCDGLEGAYVTINPSNRHIIAIALFEFAPPFEPSILPFSSNMLEFDSLGNYLSYRPYELDLNQNHFDFDFMQNGNFVVKEYNDSAEYVFPCSNIQPGSDKVGYFNYETGPFSFPSKCQVYGSPNLYAGSESIFGDELVGDSYYTPSGFYKDNGDYDTSEFNILAFNPDSSKLDWFKGFNVPISQLGFDEGHHILGVRLLDSITVIDSLTFTHELGKTESLFLSYYNCMYFKPNTEISQINDTIRLLASDLEADWYLNGNLVAVNSESYIVPNQSGIYHAIMRNEFGCTMLSDSSAFSVALNDEILNQVKVFPNPARDHIIFESNDLGNAEIKIYDLRGLIIENRKSNSKELRLNISKYPQGLYIYNIQTENGIVSGKFVKE